ncbi:MAG TPA: (5-formylfuran-3-yl)methyl phosphate synthase [Gemmatimonadaceae bacterium]|nr:(5-formylfuran-3-yl)methyl phosphate synthase [Gemmatimonadaceae bacterium]
MRLLVSVRNVDEARAALAGGAQIIDAKEPAHGALGAVSPGVLRDIRAAVGNARPISAALGDATDVATVERAAREAAALGLAYVKVGFRGIVDIGLITQLLAAAVRGARAAGTGTSVVAVAYADAARVASAPPGAIIPAAAGSGARGALLDTACKDGDALFALMTPATIAHWVRAAHKASLTAALAGKLAACDIPALHILAADIIGVRGAACDGGRDGRVSEQRVRALVQASDRSTGVRSCGSRPDPR